MTEKHQKPTIKECYWLRDGKCTSQEIYRKVNGMETGDACPFDPDEWAFKDWHGIQPHERMKCLEFAPRRDC